MLEKYLSQDFKETIDAINIYLEKFKFLNACLTQEGYLMVVYNVVNGNFSFLNLVKDALKSYVNSREMYESFKNLSNIQKIVLNFAYNISQDYDAFKQVILKIIPFRIYYEVMKIEEENKSDLASLINFDGLTQSILKFKEKQIELSKQISATAFYNDYVDFYESSKNNKDYLYQI